MTKIQREETAKKLEELKKLRSSVNQMIEKGTLGGNGRHDFVAGIEEDIRKQEQLLKVR